MLFFDALFKFYFAQPLCKNYKHAQKSLTILHQLDALFCFTLIVNITTEDTEKVIIDRNSQTAKTFNNCVTPLRGVFEVAVKNNVIHKNPMNKIKNRKVQGETLDPFVRTEIQSIFNEKQPREVFVMATKACQIPHHPA